MATLPAEFRFTPITKEPFEWREELPDGEERLIGQYHPGMTYNCTKELTHKVLRGKCEEWVEKGMIQIIPLLPGQKFVVTKTKVKV